MATVNNSTASSKVYGLAPPDMIKDRVFSAVGPRHLCMGAKFRQGQNSDEIHIRFHTLGSSVIWDMDVREVIDHPRLMAGLNREDAVYVTLLFTNQREQGFYSSVLA